MPANAVISSTYRWRLALIALMCLGFGLYCIYDGSISYPAHNRKVGRYNELKRDYPDQDAFWNEWKKVAEGSGWPTTDPGNPKTRSDIATQYIMAAITLPLGLVFGWSYLASFRRWVATDADGLFTNGGQRVAFRDIQLLNKERWRSKGIAVVQYKENGVDRKIELDDWKYDTEPTKLMVQEVELHLKPEQIVGDIPASLPPTTPPQA